MSKPNTASTYRHAAHENITQALDIHNQLSDGPNSTEVITAVAARAQTLSMVAIAQALLDIAEAIRQTHPTP